MEEKKERKFGSTTLWDLLNMDTSKPRVREENPAPSDYTEEEVNNALAAYNVPEVSKMFGHWAVSMDADVVAINKWGYVKPERGICEYPIYCDAIWDSAWEEHLSGKAWFSETCKKDFNDAMQYARKLDSRLRPKKWKKTKKV